MHFSLVSLVSMVYLVNLVCLVDLVSLVCLVCLAGFELSLLTINFELIKPAIIAVKDVLSISF